MTANNQTTLTLKDVPAAFAWKSEDVKFSSLSEDLQGIIGNLAGTVAKQDGERTLGLLGIMRIFHEEGRGISIRALGRQVGIDPGWVSKIHSTFSIFVNVALAQRGWMLETVPVLDDAGKPVLNDQGQPETEEIDRGRELVTAWNAAAKSGETEKARDALNGIWEAFKAAMESEGSINAMTRRMRGLLVVETGRGAAGKTKQTSKKGGKETDGDDDVPALGDSTVPLDLNILVAGLDMYREEVQNAESTMPVSLVKLQSAITAAEQFTKTAKARLKELQKAANEKAKEKEKDAKENGGKATEGATAPTGANQA